MDAIAILFIGLEVLLLVVAVILLVWLIFRRIRLKKEEDFEKRNN